MRRAPPDRETGMERKWQGIGLVGWLLVVAVAAWFGSQFMPGAWYAGLEKPAWTPPSWLFGPVWTLLYVAMAIAAWLVWRERGFSGAPVALGLFLLQLSLNAAWSWLFFGLQRPDLAFAEIVVLWGAILATLTAFGRIRAAAGWLLAPYLAWVTFAAALNFAIWRLNA
jgi:translocator protein